MNDGVFPDPLPEGYQLDVNVIESELAAAAMGRIYRALDSKLKLVVAVNVLAVELRDQAGRSKFVTAVANACSARRRVYEFGEWLGVPYVVVGYSEERGALVDVSKWRLP